MGLPLGEVFGGVVASAWFSPCPSRLRGEIRLRSGVPACGDGVARLRPYDFGHGEATQAGGGSLRRGGDEFTLSGRLGGRPRRS